MKEQVLETAQFFRSSCPLHGPGDDDWHILLGLSRYPVLGTRILTHLELMIEMQVFASTKHSSSHNVLCLFSG